MTFFCYVVLKFFFLIQVSTNVIFLDCTCGQEVKVSLSCSPHGSSEGSPASSLNDGWGARQQSEPTAAQKHFAQTLLPGIRFALLNRELKLRVSDLLIYERQKKMFAHNGFFPQHPFLKMASSFWHIHTIFCFDVLPFLSQIATLRSNIQCHNESYVILEFRLWESLSNEAFTLLKLATLLPDWNSLSAESSWVKIILASSSLYHSKSQVQRLRTAEWASVNINTP